MTAVNEAKNKTNKRIGRDGMRQMDQKEKNVNKEFV